MTAFVPLDGRSSPGFRWFVTNTYSKRLASLTLSKELGVSEGGHMQDHLMSAEAPQGNQSSSDLKALLESYERSLIVEALTASGGHQRRTAARLGVLPTTLHEKMKRLGLLRRPEPEPGTRTPSPSDLMRYPASAAEGRA